MVLITGVDKGSISAKKGIQKGDHLVSINDHEICDVLDFRFYLTEETLTLKLLRNQKPFLVKIKKDPYDDIGLQFHSYLMDRQHHCKNACIFCFIDQNPKGMRETIYFKDDDERMSFLFGSYITLTNLSERDVQRICDMHISPINISVQCMDKDTRVFMMKNKHAGECLSIIDTLAKANIKMNFQLVLCPGINDGEKLIDSMHKLAAYYPAIQSAAIVPVGLTRHREGLFPLSPYTRESACQVLDTVENFGEEMLRKHGQRLFYPADEFYLLAQRPIPEDSFYEDYDQLENGVGMLRLLQSEFMPALEMEEDDGRVFSCACATGFAAYETIRTLASAAETLYNNVQIHVYPIRNDFYGESVTVSGLITGQDLIAQLKGKELPSILLIPQTMLIRDGDVFLDGIPLEQVENELQVTVVPVRNDGGELFDAMRGEFYDTKSF